MTALALVLTALLGCSEAAEHPPAARQPIQDQVVTPRASMPAHGLVWALDSEPASLDWVYSYDYPPNQVLANVCESLLRIDASFMPQPGLAETVEHPGRLTWVYHLRRGVRFHGGALMTARDAAFSLRRHLDPSVGSYWSAFFDNVRDIRATGPLEVTVRLRHPDVLFPQMMAVAGGVVANRRSVLAAGERFGAPGGSLDCTGPFRLESWRPGRSIVLRRFEDYWDPDRAAVSPSIRFRFTGSTRQLRAGLRDGRFDGMFYAPSGSNEAGSSSRGPQTAVRSLVVADLEGPLADVRVRRALSLALNREKFIDEAGLGKAEPARAVVSSLTWGRGEARSIYERAWHSLPAPTRDLHTARALLRRAGRPQEPIVVALVRNKMHDALARVLRAACRDLGLRLRIKRLPYDDYGALFYSPKARRGVDLFHTTWYADVADPLEVYLNFTSSNSANFAGWHNRGYDEVAGRALAEEDPVLRAQLVARLQRMVQEQVLWIPLEQSDHNVWMRRGLTGAPTTNAYLYYPWAADLGRS